MGYHDRLGVPSQRLLENPGQLGVTVVDVVGAVGAQSVDTVGQRQQGAVDVSSFNHSLPTILLRIIVENMLH